MILSCEGVRPTFLTYTQYMLGFYLTVNYFFFLEINRIVNIEKKSQLGDINPSPHLTALFKIMNKLDFRKKKHTDLFYLLR